MWVLEDCSPKDTCCPSHPHQPCFGGQARNDSMEVKGLEVCGPSSFVPLWRRERDCVCLCVRAHVCSRECESVCMFVCVCLYVRVRVRAGQVVSAVG